MNNKGFTLLEVMGVLMLLVVILIVTIPNITGTIKKNNVDQMEDYKNTFCLAAEAYILEENIKITTDFEIKGSELVSKNYLSANLSNPDNKRRITNDIIIVKKMADGSIYCELKD